MITLTANAVSAVRAALASAASPTAGLRIMVETGGCAGFKYKMQLEEAAQSDDTVVDTDGIKIFIDDSSGEHVAGMTVDFVTGLEASGFVFDNPNAASKCGCGKSFG